MATHHQATRFALLRHEMPAGHERPSHWDLLLEHGRLAWTWELLELPLSWHKEGVAGPLSAHRLPDHRLYYLDYEGPVSGDRGRVIRWAAGSCHWLSVEPTALRAQLACSEWSTQIELLDLQNDNRWQLDVLLNPEL